MRRFRQRKCKMRGFASSLLESDWRKHCSMHCSGYRLARASSKKSLSPDLEKVSVWPATPKTLRGAAALYGHSAGAGISDPRFEFWPRELVSGSGQSWSPWVRLMKARTSSLYITIVLPFLGYYIRAPPPLHTGPIGWQGVTWKWPCWHRCLLSGDCRFRV